MPLDLGTLEYVREQMSLVEPVTIKRMFGGAGFYSRGHFFALIDDDTVYFKTDDSNRGDYLAVSSSAFAPFGDDRFSMDYYELPEVILDNPARLKVWMEKSIVVAMRAKSQKGSARGSNRRSAKMLANPRVKMTLAKPGKLKKADQKQPAKKSTAPKRKKARRKT